MTTEQRIRDQLIALEPEHIEVIDESARHVGHEGAAGGGGHYQLTIVSPQFTGKQKLARHRMIYAALGAMMQKEIHALAIQAFSPDEI